MRRKVAALLGPNAFAFGDYYNQMALHALVRAADEFGFEFDLVISQTSEKTLEDIRSCCRLGRYGTLIAFGNAMQGPTVTSAKEFPQQRFALIDGSAEGSLNVVSYSSDPFHVSFLCGQVASKMSGSHATGCVLWSDNWIARQWIGSFVLGAISAVPRSKVYYSFAGNADEAHAKAVLQFKEGADMIMCHAGAADLGIIRAAGENDKHVLGFLNEREVDPEHVLFDVVRHMEPLVQDAIRRTSARQFEGGKLIAMGLKEGSFDIDLENAHPKVGADEKKAIRGVISEIKRGKFDGERAKLGSADVAGSFGGIQV